MNVNINKPRNAKNPVVKQWWSIVVEENVRKLGDMEIGDFVFAVDMVKHGRSRWDTWDVTVRTTQFERNDWDRRVASFYGLANAKKFAAEYAAYYAGLTDVEPTRD
jgi:hypothetical protein